MGYRPELMHHQADRDQEKHNEPGAQLCAITQQDAQAAGNGQHAGKRNRDRSQRHALRSRIADGLLVKMIGSSHQENQREQKPSQNDHCTLPKACCLRILGNCDRIRCHELPPFGFSAYEQPRKLSLSAPAKIDFLLFSISELLTGRSLEPGNSLEPTPKTRLAVCPLFCWLARFGRANRNLSTCASGSNRTFPRSQRLQQRDPRRLPLALD